VYCLGNKLLSGSGLAGDDYSYICLDGLADQIVDILYCGTLAQYGLAVGIFFLNFLPESGYLS
jgi:hypothetical protein